MTDAVPSALKFFSSIDRLELMNTFQKKSCAAGEIICKSGEPNDEMFIVLSGRLEALKSEPKEGESDVLMTIDAGGISGETSFMTGRKRSASVRAPVPTDILVVTRDKFNALKTKKPLMAVCLYEAALDQAIRRFRSLSDQKNLLSYWM